MSGLKQQSTYLNVYFEMSDDIWDKMPSIYEKLNGWMGLGSTPFGDEGYGIDGLGEEGVPYWFGFDENKKCITASVDFDGLFISGNMDTEEWYIWINNFKEIASEILGFKVEEINDEEIT